MSKRTNYNSIVFLTTLSVYLGLVLAGGSVPQVLAQAALTRDFDIQSEIEFKDDLDKKPDNEEIDSFFEIGLDQAVAGFFEDLRRLKEEGKYKSNFKKIFLTGCGHSVCPVEDSAAASTSFEYQENEIYAALRRLHERLDIANTKDLSQILFVGVSEETHKSCKDIGLNLSFSKKELEIAVRFSKESTSKAVAFTDHLNQKFTDKSSVSSDLLAKQLYANTTARFENNQVFVVTRLPRASIDEFLK